MSMKDIIKKVLDRHKNGQGNMGSDSFREMLAVEIEAVLLSRSEDTQGLPYHSNHLVDEDSPFHHEMYPWHRNESWSVSQYNRNRPIEEQVQSVEEITRGLDEEG